MKNIINIIWFVLSVMVFAVATVYTGAFLLNGSLKGFSCYTLNDYFYEIIIGVLIINTWHNVKDVSWWWKPFKNTINEKVFPKNI